MVCRLPLEEMGEEWEMRVGRNPKSCFYAGMSIGPRLGRLGLGQYLLKRAL